MRSPKTLFACIAILLSLITASPLLAAPKTWVGRSIFPNNNLWSNAGNWDVLQGGAPTHGDTVYFTPAGFAQTTSSADYGVTLAGLYFKDEILQAPSYTIVGSGILTLPGELGNQSKSPQTVNTPLRVGIIGTSITNIEPQAGRLTIGGSIDTAGNNLFADAGPAGIAISGAISGAGNFVTGPSNLTTELLGLNTYTGGTSITNGTVRLTGAGRLPDVTNVSVSPGALIEWVGITDAINRLGDDNQGGGTVRLSGNSTLILGAAGANSNFSGTIQGTGGLTKRGIGVLQLTGPYTYTGDTILEQGEISVRGLGQLSPATDLTIASGATFTVFDNINNTIGSLSGAGTVNLRLAGSRLTVGAPGSGGGGTFTGPIIGPGGLTKRGPATLNISGPNTFTGETIIEQGLLELLGTSNISNRVAISSPGTLQFEGVRTFQTLSGAGTVSMYNNATVVVTGTSTFSGYIQGIGGLTKRTTGTLTFSGVGVYFGATLIDGGTLAVSSTAISDLSPVIVKSGLYTMSGFPGIYAPPSLEVQTLGTARLAAGSDKLLRTSNVTIAGNGKLDLADNDMVLTAANLDTITTLIATARNTGPSGLWSGPGITSTTAAASGLSLGAILNDNGSGQRLYPSFHGATGLSATDILVGYTVVGDLNLDGIVSISDFIDLASHFGVTSATWRMGDVNYDRQVSISDFIDLAANFGATYSSSAALSQPQPQAVPEPAMMVTGALAIGCACLRRRPGARPESAAF